MPIAIVELHAPAPMKFDPKERIAFIQDPDGYTIELIERFVDS